MTAPAATEQPVTSPGPNAGAKLRIVGGQASLGGTNPTAIATGLTNVTAAWAVLANTAAPGVATSVLTVDLTVGPAGTINVNGWKVTSSANPTLIASTGTDLFNWFAIGY